jgi:hypothetical protein
LANKNFLVSSAITDHQFYSHFFLHSIQLSDFPAISSIVKKLIDTKSIEINDVILQGLLKTESNENVTKTVADFLTSATSSTNCLSLEFLPLESYVS